MIPTVQGKKSRLRYLVDVSKVLINRRTIEDMYDSDPKKVHNNNQTHAARE